MIAKVAKVRCASSASIDADRGPQNANCFIVKQSLAGKNAKDAKGRFERRTRNGEGVSARTRVRQSSSPMVCSNSIVAGRGGVSSLSPKAPTRKSQAVTQQ